MEVLNKWKCSEFEIVLVKTKKNIYQIDINTNNRETNYCYEFKNKKEAEEFFDSMWRHIFIV